MESGSEVGGQKVGQGHAQNVANDVFLGGIGLLLELKQLQQSQVGFNVRMLVSTLSGGVFLENGNLLGIVPVQGGENRGDLLRTLLGLFAKGVHGVWCVLEAKGVFH